MNGIPTIDAGAERRLRECIAAWVVDHEIKTTERENVCDDSAAAMYGRQAHAIATAMDQQVKDLGAMLQLWMNHFPGVPFPGVPFARLKSLHARMGTMLSNADVRCQTPETREKEMEIETANHEWRTTNSKTQTAFSTLEAL